jgi:hypothetical protein
MQNRLTTKDTEEHEGKAGERIFSVAFQSKIKNQKSKIPGREVAP